MARAEKPVVDAADVAAMHADSKNWHVCSQFYVARQDPRVCVPKRSGLGCTVNLGHPWGPFVLLLTIGVVLAIVFGVRAALGKSP